MIDYRKDCQKIVLAVFLCPSQYFLYSALALRLNKKVFTPDVVFTLGISADANLIYKLHLNFTSEFYHRQVSLFSLERCEELFKEINGINL